jgi:hypothetical protein
MNADKSYLTERLAERRRQVRAGVAGVGLLMALGLALLFSYPTPREPAPSAERHGAATTAYTTTTTAMR